MPGRSVRSTHLQPRQWFAAGDTVQVVAAGRGFSVSGEGQALTPGIEGQPARVRTESGRILTGRAGGRTPGGGRTVNSASPLLEGLLRKEPKVAAGRTDTPTMNVGKCSGSSRQENTMKIGNPAEKPQRRRRQTAPAAPANGGGRGGQAAGRQRRGRRRQRQGRAVQLRPASLMAGAATADFDAEKVARISQAIADGSFKINAEVIADKLIANAQEVLGKVQR